MAHFALPFRPVLAAATAALAAGCAVSVPPSELHPSVRSAPASADFSDEAMVKTALETAAADLRCAHVEVVLTLDRRYANGTAARYVVEGCGQRGLYVETCVTFPQCRYLLVSLLRLPSKASPSSVPPPPSPPSVLAPQGLAPSGEEPPK